MANPTYMPPPMLFPLGDDELMSIVKRLDCERIVNGAKAYLQKITKKRPVFTEPAWALQFAEGDFGVVLVTTTPVDKYDPYYMLRADRDVRGWKSITDLKTYLEQNKVVIAPWM